MSQEEKKDFNKDKLIDYDLVLDMLSLSSLVYNFIFYIYNIIIFKY